MRQMPVKIVNDGVLTRSVRDTAAFLRESEKVWRNLRLPPVGDLTRPGRARLRVAVVAEGVGVAATPEVAELTLKTAGALRSSATGWSPRCSTCRRRSRTTSSSTGRC